MSRSHYEVLGATRQASSAQLRRAYLQRARKLHPDQFVGRPTEERARAERRMQELNAAWTVLSNPDRRRAYDASLDRSSGARGPATGPRGTGPIVAGRDGGWRPYDGAGPAVPPRPEPGPVVADERSMRIRGPARLIRPVPLLVMLAALVGLVVLASLTADGDPVAPDGRSGAAIVVPTGTPIGCIRLLPVAEEVPCGDHDAVVWRVIAAGESCPEDLEAIYRQGIGGLYCVTRDR